MKLLKNKWHFLVLIFLNILFFHNIFSGLLPIPSDTIIGLYHPFRDLYKDEYPNGIPFKNFLLTDPVRQIIPWKEFALQIIKRNDLPLWNPYSFSGYPLLANFQSGVFYPLNIFFLILPFTTAWTLFIFTQPLLASLFMYLYLKNLRLSKIASLLGSITYSFSGFFIAWLTWGTVLHAICWLPLILLSLDKILKSSKKILVNWIVIFILSLLFSFLSGHLQTAFYVVIMSILYAFVRWRQYGGQKKILAIIIFCYSLLILLTSVQWLPTLQLILESARNIDQNYNQPGWFIPISQLVQFIAPDFFGNPTTLNYTGVWNYAEFIGYIGIIPLLFGFYAMVFRHDKKTLFYFLIFLVALLFAIKNPISELPYRFNIPLVSTSQPTRLLGIVDFSLAVLASLGLDLFLKEKKFKRIFLIVSILGVVLLALWIITVKGNLGISQRNLILPTLLLALSMVILTALFKTKQQIIRNGLISMTILIVVFDLFRFGQKFTPFTKKDYLFPQTKVIDFLQQKQKEDYFRIMSLDDRIFPPNFSLFYRLESVDGYDPLYLRRYGELIAASERGEPNIEPPFGFNRIITPKKYDSKIIDLLGVKYLLSLVDLESPKLTKVFQEGETKVYENKNALPRAFFVENIERANNKQDAINKMLVTDLSKAAIVEDLASHKFSLGKTEIITYSENRVTIKTQNEKEGFLVLTDSFYPSWRVIIDNKEGKIIRTDYNFRGVSISKGEHIVEFYNSLF